MALATPADDPIQIESGIKIKKEKEDEEETSNHNSSSNVKKLIVSDPQFSELQSRNITITVAPSQTEKAVSVLKPTVQTPKKSADSIPSRPSSPPPPDYTSRCKAFGWATIGSVHLPFIMRGENKFVAARILDEKIVGTYINILPNHIFKFTHVDSFYMTEAEIILYNEINEFHCDLQFGYPKFTSSDVVVGLEDCMNYYEFLETCKTKLDVQVADLSYSNKCGFYNIKNECVPYIKKGTKRFIPLNGVPVELMPSVNHIEKISEWDKSYFRLLYGKLLADTLPIQQICCIEDLENALGGINFEEVWSDLRSVHMSNLSSSNDTLSKWENSVIQSPSVAVENAKKIREKINEIQEKDSMFSSFLGLDKFINMTPSLSRAAHLTQNPELQNGLGSISSSDKTNMFPMSIENLLVTSTPNYPYSVNYSNQYSSHLQTPSMSDLERFRKMEESLPSLSSNRPKPFPPPPPLVRLGGSRASSVPTDSSVVPKATPSIYPYIPAPSNPWISRILESDWLREEERVALQQKDTPENLSRRFSENDLWCPTSLSSSSNLNGAGSSNLVRSNSNPAGVLRDSYDLTSGSLCRDDRMLHPHGGSPRLLAGPGPPPHYPTPPQSSPLQPLSLMDCATAPIVPDLYTTRTTPNGLDLCSPPPSPEIRTALSSSPRGSLLSSYAYHPHIARLMQVDTRFMLAINIEPLKYSSMLAVPLSDVVNKFLRGSSIQSCQIVLETYGLQLYECTSLQHEAFAKHNVSVPPGSKLILLTDLKNYIQQLKLMLLEREKQKETNCDFTASESPLSKRWCNNAREC